MNKDISSGDDVRSTFRSDVGETDKLDTAIQWSSADKRNTTPLQIEEGGPKSIFPKIVKQSNLSKRMNLVNSLVVQIPKLLLLRHLPMKTENVGHQGVMEASLPE